MLTHLARNADSHVRLVQAAVRGEVGEQYPGGNPQREADIEAGAGRPAAELVEDVLAAADRWETAFESAPEEVLRTGQGRVVGGLWPLAELPFRRCREVEVHHVDLGLAYDPSDWPEEYVEEELARALAELPERLPPGVAIDLRATDSGARWLVPEGPVERPTVATDRRTMLVWLLGRRPGGPGFPPLAPWTG